MNITKPTKKAAQITIYGQPGIGKTTLASLMPKPIFLPIEDGLMSIAGTDVSAFDRPKNSADIIEALTYLANEKHDFKTLVLDSVSALDIMLIKETFAADKDGKQSLATAHGGYGGAYSYLSNLHRRIKELLNKLNDKIGINIVYISHVAYKTVNEPDSLDEYSVATLQMEKKSVPFYRDDVDAVFYLKLDKVISEKKAIDTGKRILYCLPSNNHVSKNRLGIKENLIFKEGENPIEEYL